LLRRLGFATALTLVGGLAVANSHDGGDPSVGARQGLMKLNGHNLYYMLAMSRGRIDYDAASAQAAADSLVALTQVNQMRMWPPGTDSDALLETRALPALWENFPDVMEKVGAVKEAALALQAVAGDGLEPMTAAASAVNDACNACHKQYRMSDN